MDDLAETVRLVCLVRGKMTLRTLAVRSGIAEARLEKLLRRDPMERKQASGSELLSIWGALGVPAASLGLAAIGMAAVEDDVAGADVRLQLAVADLFDAGADLARLAVDGRIDADESDAALEACDRAEEKVTELRRAARAARQPRR